MPGEWKQNDFFASGNGPAKEVYFKLTGPNLLQSSHCAGSMQGQLLVCKTLYINETANNCRPCFSPLMDGNFRDRKGQMSQWP